MHWDMLAIILGVVTAVWGSAYLGWRWSRKKLGLDAREVPEMGQRERTVRRSLSALLGFNFFVIWPLGLPACAALAMFMFDDREMLGPSLAALLGFVAFTVAVPSLIGTVRQLERQRLLGQADAVPPSLWIEGGAALVSGQGAAAPRWPKYAILGVLVIVGIFNWKMTAAVMFYGLIFAVARVGWKLLTRLWRA